MVLHRKTSVAVLIFPKLIPFPNLEKSSFVKKEELFVKLLIEKYLRLTRHLCCTFM